MKLDITAYIVRLSHLAVENDTSMAVLDAELWAWMMATMRDLSVLSDVEFEELAADLVAAEKNTSVERFARGRDGGIDLRWRLTGSKQRGIGQCKHYVRSSFNDLLRAAKAEIAHLKSLNPGEYLFITSFDLTPGQKTELLAVFQNWMLDVSSILGARDMDGLLTRHADVEKRHVKLWISSGSQLFWAVHNDKLSRSAVLQSRVKAALPRYVVNGGYDRARALLRKNHVCLIAGLPGIGKTMLAQMLLAEAMTEGYDPIEVSGDIGEAWSVLDWGSKQIFLYDDFLGQITFSERLGKNEDDRLSQFINTIATAGNKRLVLTTREYILNDARQQYPKLACIDQGFEFILELKDYTRMDKAKILYSHLWHSNLPRDAVRSIASGPHLKIIDHRNYIPRLIEYCTTSDLDVSPDQYASQFLFTLDHPREIWNVAFERHLTEDQKALLLTLATMSQWTYVDELRKAHQGLCAALQISAASLNYRSALQTLEGSFISIDKDGNGSYVSFANPSIREYVIDYLSKDFGLTSIVVRSVISWEQLRTLYASAIGERYGRRKQRGDLLASLERSRGEFIESVKRCVGVVLQEFPDETRSVDWRENAVIFVLELADDWSPSKGWMVEILNGVAEQWRVKVGDKSKAVVILEAIIGQDYPKLLLDKCHLIVGDWVASTVDETKDWKLLIDYAREVDGRRVFDDYDLAAEFEEHARSEMERWSPAPPDIDDLIDYADEFGLYELREELKELEQVLESESDDDDDVAPIRRPSGSDKAIDRLFSRFLQT